MKIHRAVSLLLIPIAACAAAQDHTSDQATRIEQQPGRYSAWIQDAQFSSPSAIVAGAPYSFAGDVVTGAPYSAEAVTESIQMLADGNRIRQRNEAKLYRDSEGRTRREQSLSALGPWQVLGGGGQMVFLNDPVEQQNFILDLDKRTARRFTLPRLTVQLNGSGGHTRSMTLSAAREDGPKGDVVFMPAPAIGFMGPVGQSPTGQSQSTENLGERDIEGVPAFGTRTTTIIDANAIGNERPIEVTTEQWFSPALGSMVMSRHSDPRFGEVTYRLINVSLSEPEPALFQVPDGFEVIDASSGGSR